MQNSMMMFTFLVFESKYPFLGKFGPKSQNYQLKLKFGTYTNSNMQNSMVMFILSVFDWKYPFWANLVQKIKIVTLCWNLVPRLIRICRIQWCCSLFLFSSGNSLLGQIWSKLLYLQFFFLFPIRNVLFWENLVQNVKVVSLSLNLLATIFCKIYLEFSRFHWKSWFEVKV